MSQRCQLAGQSLLGGNAVDDAFNVGKLFEQLSEFRAQHAVACKPGNAFLARIDAGQIDQRFGQPLPDLAFAHRTDCMIYFV